MKLDFFEKTFFRIISYINFELKTLFNMSINNQLESLKEIKSMI